MIKLPVDFKEFLKSLNDHDVRYLLMDGYAVGYHGFPRGTLDIDSWVPFDRENSVRLSAAIRDFGFEDPSLAPDAFTSETSMLRFGVPPLRIEILAYVSGVDFGDCYQRRVVDNVDGVEVSIISLEDLKVNKRASGRKTDIEDVERLGG